MAIKWLLASMFRPLKLPSSILEILGPIFSKLDLLENLYTGVLAPPAPVAFCFLELFFASSTRLIEENFPVTSCFLMAALAAPAAWAALPN